MGGWKPWWTREASRTRFIAVPACLRTLFFPSFFLFFFYVQYRGILELFRSVLRVPEELATLRLPVSISLRPWIFPSESSLYIVPPDFSFAIFLQDFSLLRDENWIEITETRKILFFWKVLEESYADYSWIPLSRLVGFYILLIRRWNFIRVFIG